MIYMRHNIIIAALPASLLLLGLAATNQAWGYWNDGEGGGGGDY
jgi:hypothetical protein